MLSCGHFYCIKCLDEQVHADISRNKSHCCPSCRSSFSPVNDVIHIDHLANNDEEETAKRSKAKAKVLEASKLLATSEGVLEGNMWKSLFLSIDVPPHVTNAPHHLHTALPGDALAHFRAATSMKVDSDKSDSPISWSNEESLENNLSGLSTKMQNLLHDLPCEHAVVFSSSKEGVLHTATVLKARGIECFSLYTGQDTKATEKCVSSWKSAPVDASKCGPVLVVQAGAAASGLTLTKASKLFLLEPFSRQEEEQQAYARLHRYGQTKDVHVKIYYAPVTVESRLLKWRKRSVDKLAEVCSGMEYQFLEDEGEESDDDMDEDSTNYCSDVDREEGDDEDETKSDQENDQSEVGEDRLRTQFLLGLIDENGNPTTTNNGRNAGVAVDVASARRFILD